MLDYSVFENAPEIPESSFAIEPYGDGVLITEYWGNESLVRIPESIDGKTVLALTPLTFGNRCRNLLIPKYVQDLVSYYDWPEDWAEHICIHPDNQNLSIAEGLLMNADHTKVFLRSDPTLTQIRIPDKVTEICAGAFASGQNIVGIHLGAGVTTIGERAFPDSKAGVFRIHGQHDGSYKQLAFREITVSADNAYFSAREGFLYTKDFSTLIHAPEMIPDGIYSVPAEVKNIAPEAFARNQGIRLFRANHPIDTIGQKAFYDCFKLENVEVAHVDTVDEEAFCECEGLVRVKISSVGILKWQAFSACHKLNQLAIESADIICDRAFSGCWALREVVLPSDLKEIQEEVFAYSGSKGLNIVLYDAASLNPGKLAYTRDYSSGEMRWECEQHWITVKSAENDRILYRIYMGRAKGTASDYREAVINGWAKYPEFDFESLDKAFSLLREADEKLEVARLRLTYPVSLSEETRKQYMDYLRRSARKALARSVSENDVETVRFLSELGILKRDAVDEAVGLCDGTKDPELMALLLSLQENAAGKPKDALKMPSYTAMLKKLWSTQKLPDGTLELTSYKGEEEEVLIPTQIGNALVTRLGDHVMNWVGANVVKAEKLKKIKKVIIPEGITGIGASAFLGCCNITEITLPQSLREIGSYAFSSCSGLKDMKLPQGLTRLEKGCFSDCANLRTVNIPETVTEIGSSAFDGCKALAGIIIGEQVTSIEDYAFSNCPGLQDENGFVILRDVLYNYYGSAQNLVVPEQVRTVSGFSFPKNAAVQTVKLPEGLIRIGRGAFAKCAVLREINIPSTVKVLEPCLFEKCARLERVSLHDAIENVGYGVFKGCKTLKEISFPPLLTTISKELFAGCASVEMMVIPESVTEIQDDAFRRCVALREIHIPGSVTKIVYNAFYDCPNLTIHAPAGSYAETHAKISHIPFVAE